MPFPTVVLDTHTWMWWASDRRRLSRAAMAVMAPPAVLGVSPISCWEVATKVALGRIELDRDPRLWIRQALAAERVEPAELTAEIAATAGLLGAEGFHGDPADRMIAATALHLQVPLVTKDTQLRTFRRLRTVW